MYRDMILCCEHYTNAHQPFTDFQAAYDTVWRKETWSEIHKLGPQIPLQKLNCAEFE
jgi:hypothetical protein